MYNEISWNLKNVYFNRKFIVPLIYKINIVFKSKYFFHTTLVIILQIKNIWRIQITRLIANKI